jgi:phosphoribosylglycinamide formyltransferase-1
VVRPLPIAVLVSGEGTTLDALADRVEAGQLPAEIRLVVSDRASALALEKARRHGLVTLLLPSRGVDPETWARRVNSELEAKGVELVVLAGFLTILPRSWVARWRGRAVNLHPALLPQHGGPGMYGTRVHEAVLAAHETETGVTVHLVTGDVDGGPRLAQERVPVLPGDTPAALRERLHPIEVRLLAETIGRFAEGALPLPYPDSDASARDAGDRSAVPR